VFSEHAGAFWVSGISVCGIGMRLGSVLDLCCRSAFGAKGSVCCFDLHPGDGVGGEGISFLCFGVAIASSSRFCFVWSGASRSS
jgi:hypothetical protein